MTRDALKVATTREIAERQHEEIRAMYREGKIDPIEEDWLHDQVTAFKIERELHRPKLKPWSDDE